ncbi:hypothetical protein SRHO_G00034650 [Serrasalmus rhombeus]
MAAYHLPRRLLNKIEKQFNFCSLESPLTLDHQSHHYANYHRSEKKTLKEKQGAPKTTNSFITREGT